MSDVRFDYPGGLIGYAPNKKLLEHDAAQREMIRRLEDWRADVTAALSREAGAFFADVPKHIKGLVQQNASLQARLTASESDKK